jgi:Rnl2 family RNA ligase
MEKRIHRKFSIIEGYHNKRFFDNYINSEVYDSETEFVATEKIHGTNFSIYTSNSDKPVFARRNAFLGYIDSAQSEKFYDYQSYFTKGKIIFDVKGDYILCSDMLKTMDEYSKITNKNMIWYGEYFGSGVMNEISYIEDNKFKKNFRLFYIIQDDQRMSVNQEIDLLIELGLMSVYVPVINIEKGLDNIVKTDIRIPSKLSPLNPKKNLPIEGCVIRMMNDRTHEFKFKIKNVEFSEGSTPSEKKEVGEGAVRLYNIFSGYINENRIKNVLSKEIRQLKSKKDFEYFIPLIVEDAEKDFRSDYADELERITEQHQNRMIFKQGRYAASILSSMYNL